MRGGANGREERDTAVVVEYCVLFLRHFLKVDWLQLYLPALTEGLYVLLPLLVAMLRWFRGSWPPELGTGNFVIAKALQ